MPSMPLASIETPDPARTIISTLDPVPSDRKPLAMSPSSLRRRRPSSRLLLSTLLLVLVVLLPQSAQAVRITFDNCLPQSYRDHKPERLQWVPLYVDAFFDTENESHNLRVTAWGNVTGSASSAELPPADHPDWSDPDVTRGKIIREPDPDGSDPRATTLIRKVNVLSYEPYRDLADFCNDALENATCPLGPVFDTRDL